MDQEELEDKQGELMRHQLTEGECRAPFPCRTCDRIEEALRRAGLAP